MNSKEVNNDIDLIRIDKQFLVKSLIQIVLDSS